MAISELNLLFQRCLHRRIRANEFCALLKQFNKTRNSSSKSTVAAWINCSIAFCIEGDPLLLQYMQALIINDFAKVSEFVAGLILQWNSMRDSEHTRSSNYVKTVTNLNVIASITNFDNTEVTRCIHLLSRWLAALATTADSGLGEAVGFFLISFLNHPVASKLTTPVQQAIDRCMTTLPNVSMQLMTKISTVPKEPVSDPSPHLMNMAAFEFEANIQDTPVVASRAATTAFLHGLLRHGTTIDDSAVLAFLNTRHQGNHATIFNDLVFASIDAMIKYNTNEMYQAQCQTFILNKLPAILAFIVTSAFESFSSENSLVDGWNYLSVSNTNHDVGKKFLQMCTFYHLISNDTVTTLVGENTLKGLYAKDDLVSQVIANHSRGPRLVEELLKSDGNAGSISQAIVEVMHNYCHMKETQNLKDMANAIVRKPLAINSIALFVKPFFFLGPFCSLLDEWKWDEIHGESQPVYDEFGSILLLICAFHQRLELKISDLGIQQNGFLAKYLEVGYAEQEFSKLSEAAQTNLGTWVKSLYIDEGLSDDLTSSCSAQDFYLLVPTLLRQSLLAHSTGKLNDDSLKAGLEYLLEPFLLPSLLPTFCWIGQIADREPKAALMVLQTLIKESGNLEAREIHQTIIAMAADKLEDTYIGSDSSITSTIATMKKNSRFGIDTSIKESDLTSWSNTEGGIDALLTQAIAQHSEVAFSPKLLTGAIRAHGPQSIMHMIINLILQLSETQNLSALLDFIATIIVGGDPALRLFVQIFHSKIGIFLKKGENLYAEAVVHLARRVELYTTALAAQDPTMDHSFAPMAGLNVTNVNLDVGAAPTFEQNNKTQNEDIDQVLNEAAAMGGIDQVDNNGFDEMYDLSGNDLGLGNLDDLDLEMF